MTGQTNHGARVRSDKRAVRQIGQLLRCQSPMGGQFMAAASTKAIFIPSRFAAMGAEPFNCFRLFPG